MPRQDPSVTPSARRPLGSRWPDRVAAGRPAGSHLQRRRGVPANITVAVAAVLALASCGAAAQPTSTGQPPVVVAKPSATPSLPTHAVSPRHTEHAKPGITVAGLKHVGILVKAPDRRPNITAKQAIRMAMADTGEEKSPSARLFRVTTTEHGSEGPNGEFEPTYRDHLTWVVTLHGRWVPHYSGPWPPPPSPDKPPKPQAFRTVQLIDAITGESMYAFA